MPIKSCRVIQWTRSHRYDNLKLKRTKPNENKNEGQHFIVQFILHKNTKHLHNFKSTVKDFETQHETAVNAVCLHEVVHRV